MPKQEELKPKKVNNEEEASLADSKKIDLYINNNGDEEKGISIMNIFSILGKRFKVYAWFIVATLLLGLLVPTLMYTFKDKEEAAVALLALDYGGASAGTDPNGNKLDISYIKSSYIVNNALNNVTLSKKISTAQVQNNLVITGLLSDETKQQQDVLDKLLQEKNNDYGKMLREFQLKYRPQYIITLDSVFKDGNKKVVLPSNDLSRLLSAITAAYNDYFVETYQDRTLPDDKLNAINEEAFDYLEILDSVSSSLSYLASYCDRCANLLPNYRTEDGLSFSDLQSIINTLRSTDIDYIYSYIYLNNIYKDKTTLKTYYQMQLRDAQLDLQETEANITTLQNSINDYPDSQIIVQTTDGHSVTVDVKSGEEKNALILRLTEANERKSALQERITDLTNRIDKLDHDPEATAEQKAKAQTYIDNALDNSKEIYNLVNEHADELFNSNAYKNRYMHSITTSQREKLSDNLKLFLLGAAAGLAIGLVVWVADAFIVEFRNVKKANEAREAK